MKNKKRVIVEDAARILNFMEDGFLRANIEGKIIMANRAIAQICGYASSEEMIGLPMKTLYANPTERNEMIKEIKVKGKLVNCELELKCKNGNTFWSLNNIKNFYDEKGNLLGTEGLIRDITEIRHTKKKLEHTNKVLAGIRNVNKLIITEKKVPELLQNICEILTSEKGYHNAWLLLLNETGKFEAVYQSGLGKEFQGIANRLKKNKFTKCALKALELKEFVSISNPIEDCLDCPLAKYYEDRGAITAPIIHNNKLYGLITVSIPRKYLIKEDVELLKELADDIGLALNSIILETKRVEAEENLKLMNSKLETANQKLKAEEQQLQSSEQQLKATNQQLQAGEQQLQASNQQLRATNQQLQSSEQQLRATNQQLVANEQELLKSKETAENYLNVAAEIILSLDKNGNITLLNKSGHQLLGYKNGELIGKNWFENCLPNTNIKEIKNVFKQTICGKLENVANYESDIQTKSGDIRTILWHNTVLQDDNGKIISVLSSGEDITERKKAEENLQAANQQLRATNQQLQSSEQQLRLNKEELVSANHNLKERIKEITCIFNITSTIIEQDTIEGILANLVQFIIPAWKYPEITIARIRFQNSIVQSDNFKETPWMQSAAITVDGKSQGSIDVFYLTEKPILDEGPFLKEERALIDTLSNIIGKSFETILKKEHIQTINQQLQAGEQQLQASNQQLRAANQQLKAINQQLQASEQQLKKSLADTKFWADLVLDSNIGVAVGYPDGKLGVSNKMYQKITGYSEKELKAIDWNTVLTPPEWLENESKKLNELHETKKAVVYEKEYIRKDGIRVPVELTVHARLDEKGEIAYYYAFVKDITERKKAENKLQETYKMHAAMIENIGDVIGIVGVDGMTKYQSPNIEKWFGWKPEDIIGTNGWDKMHPEDIERIQKEFNNILQKDTSSTVEYRFKCKNGFYKWIELTATNSIKDPLINGVLVNYHDITERKRVENELIESNKKFYALFSEMTEGVYLHEMIYDRKGKAIDYRIVETNHASEKHLNMNSEDAIGKCATELYGTKEAPYLDIYEKVTRTKLPFSFEEYFSPLKKHFHISVYSPEEGKFATVFSDITERKIAEEALKQSEEKYRLYFEHAPIGYQSLNVNGCFLDVNNAWLRILGYNRNEIIGKWFGDFLHPEQKEIFRQLFPENIKRKDIIRGVEFIIQHKNGSYIQTEFTASIQFDREGNFVRTHCAFEDVTEKRKAEQEVKESEEKFRILASISPMAIMLYQDLKWTYANKAAEMMCGYTMKDLGEMHIWDFVAPEYQELIKENAKKRLIGKNVDRPYEFKIISKDGQEKWVLLHGNNIKLNNTLTGLITVYDITDRKQAEEKLSESQQRFKQFSDLTLEGIIIHKKGVSIDVNNAVIQMTGYSREEIIGENIVKQIVVEEHLERVWQNMHKNITEAYEVTIKRKDGLLFPIEIQSRNIEFMGEDARVTVIRDITQQKIADKKLCQSEQFNRSIIENSLDCIKTLDLDGHLKFMSKGGQTLLEIDDIDSVLNKSWIDFWKGEDHKNARKAIEKAKSEEVGYFEGFCSTNKGTPKWWGVQISPIYNTEGKINEVLAVSRDITNQKKAENIKDLILNISDATYHTLNLEDLVIRIEQEISTVVNTNNIYFVMYDEEKNKLDLLLYKDEVDVFEEFPETGTITHYMLKIAKPLLATKDTFKELEEAGEIVQYGTDCKIWLGVPFNIKGRVMGAIVVQSYDDEDAFDMDDLMLLKVVSDQIGISIERKMFEEKMVIAKHKAEESDRLKSAFLANMSHEIRTPMNGILGFTDLLKEPNLTGEEQHKYIEIIKKSGDRMLNTVNDIIDISKIDAGQINIAQNVVNITEEIEIQYEFFNEEASAKGIELKLINDLPNQDVFILTDKVKLNSIFSNLIKNAIKYTDKGSIEIYCQKKNSMFEFKIKDTGIGIPEDRIESIFNRFEQADISNQHARQGSGLGLSIIEAYVEMLGGNISVESEFEKGSTFCFNLPWIENHKKADPEKDNKNLSKVFDKQINLLIAEDDDSSFEFLSIILKRVVNKIVRTTNGEETVNYLKNNKDINLVLMDINMPILNGFEATIQIKKFRPGLCIIAQTAYALTGDREKSREAGCDDYIAKPIKKEELLEKMEKFMR